MPQRPRQWDINKVLSTDEVVELRATAVAE
jgi:hypothetical protein